MEALVLIIAGALFVSIACFIYYDWRERKKTLLTVVCIFFLVVAFVFAIMGLVRLYI